MPGVDILNTEVFYITEFSSTPILVCIIVGAILGFVLGGMSDSDFDFTSAALAMILVALAGLLLGCSISVVTAKTTDQIDYVKHDVMISDEVNFNEFTEQYEIIEQKGRIYTVKERQHE